MEVVIRTRNWSELLNALKTGNVGFYMRTENGALYAPIGEHGMIDTNPSRVAEYIV